MWHYLAILGSCGNAEAGREEAKQGARVETERHEAVTKFAVGEDITSKWSKWTSKVRRIILEKIVK